VLIIGSGINGLVAAAVLARGGHRPLVLEAADRLGGAIHTAELTRPGFRHDVFSGWHPLFVGGDAYAELGDELGRHGLEYANTDVPTGVVLPDRRSAALTTDAEANVAALNALHAGDGDAWAAAMAHFGEIADLAFSLLGAELWSLSTARLAAGTARTLGTTDALRFAGEALEPATAFLGRTFGGDVAPPLLAPWVLHNGLGPDDAASGLILQVITAALQQGGCPVPVGGGQRLVDALVSLIRSHGGELRTGSRVTAIRTEQGRAVGVELADGTSVLSAGAVLASVTPQALYLDLLADADLPGWVRDEAADFRYGRGNMQIHLALDRPVGWDHDGDARLDEAAIVHVADGVAGISKAANEAGRGAIPARPTVVVGQHTAVDPTRAPEGAAVLWLQLQEMPREPVTDAAGELDTDGRWTETLREQVADGVVAQIGEHLPKLDDAIVGRAVLSPADLAAANPNLVGGDPYAGACQLDQFLLWRPLPGLPQHRAPIDNLWHIGASTHPGPGLSGASGLIAARQVLAPTPGERVTSAVEDVVARLRQRIAG
jgi:phytoene dehydrogenase-like protein